MPPLSTRAFIPSLEIIGVLPVTVSFSADESYEGDEDAKGHLWYAYLSSDIDYLYMDDRKAEPMEVQLVAERRRLSDLCREMADDAEAKIGELAVA